MSEGESGRRIGKIYDHAQEVRLAFARESVNPSPPFARSTAVFLEQCYEYRAFLLLRYGCPKDMVHSTVRLNSDRDKPEIEKQRAWEMCYAWVVLNKGINIGSFIGWQVPEDFLRWVGGYTYLDEHLPG